MSIWHHNPETGNLVSHVPTTDIIAPVVAVAAFALAHWLNATSGVAFCVGGFTYVALALGGRMTSSRALRKGK